MKMSAENYGKLEKREEGVKMWKNPFAYYGHVSIQNDKIKTKEHFNFEDQVNGLEF